MNNRNILGILLLASLWGPSFLFIKVAVHEIPPLTMAAARVTIAALILLVVLRLRKRALPKGRHMWLKFTIAGLFGNAMPFVLFNWGELYIDSALAAILNGTTPLFTLVIAHFFTDDDRLSTRKIIGAIIGFGGLLVLVAPSLFGGVEATTLGLLAVLLAAFCYGVNIVFTRTYLRGLPGLVAPAAQLSMASVLLIPVALLVDQPYQLAFPSLPAVSSLFALAIIGTGLAFIVYYRLLETTPASSMAMVTYLIPVFGIFLGVVVLNETLSWNAYVGCSLILIGVMVVNNIIRFPGKTVNV
ncbi:MAG: DMT family transporter [Calditrichia bacterium]|nr:DMT family transporter [Calditrichota bacterium]MCB0266569.1 DMT family transporter [Calditrichota bacterium]MCB9069909.1 DMT family transporter [Calditrichia bacterium]